MPSTTMSAAPGATDRRVARRRVGAAAILAFLALLLAGAVRDAAGADPAVPASAPAAPPAQQQQEQTAPSQPQRTAPALPPFPHDRERDRGPGPGPGFGGAPDDGDGIAPATPSTDGGVIT